MLCIEHMGSTKLLGVGASDTLGSCPYYGTNLLTSSTSDEAQPKGFLEPLHLITTESLRPNRRFYNSCLGGFKAAGSGGHNCPSALELPFEGRAVVPS